MKITFLSVLIFLSTFCAAQNITLPVPSGYVNDFENLFTPSQQDSLKTLLENYEKETTNEIVVVTIPANMILDADISDYTLKLLNAWGVGKKTKDNGILIGICTSRKAIRIQNGYGIEKVLSDADTKKIIDEHILPYFTVEKYFEGTYKGLLTIMKKFRRYRKALKRSCNTSEGFRMIFYQSIEMRSCSSPALPGVLFF